MSLRQVANHRQMRVELVGTARCGTGPREAGLGCRFGGVSDGGGTRSGAQEGCGLEVGRW